MAEVSYQQNGVKTLTCSLDLKERRRLQLLTVLIDKPNFLILDEPSVDLDLQTLQALESFLTDEFKGVLIVVSHDRFFADKVTDHLFIFDGNGEIRDFIGTLSEYSSALVELENRPAANNAAKSNSFDNNDEKENKLQDLNKVRQAKKNIGRLETDIEKLTKKVHQLEEKMAASSDEGWTVLSELAEDLQSAKDALSEKELLWMEAAEIVESMA